jgi:rfaE bifunctional protein nucleotidyltransferase chain/domain
MSINQMSRRDKIYTLEAFLSIRENLQKNKITLVMTNGCFDILHVGHTRSLFDAKTHGNHLMVAINSDRAVKILKGQDRPIHTEMERGELLAAIECVDSVVIFDGVNAEDLIRAVKPDVHAKGTDYTEENVPERHVVLEYGGKIAIVGDPKDHSTQSIIETTRQ